MDFKVYTTVNAYAVQLANKENVSPLADYLNAVDGINVLEVRWNWCAKIGTIILTCHIKGCNAKARIEELTSNYFSHGN